MVEYLAFAVFVARWTEFPLPWTREDLSIRIFEHDMRWLGISASPPTHGVWRLGP